MILKKHIINRNRVQSTIRVKKKNLIGKYQWNNKNKMLCLKIIVMPNKKYQK